MRAPARRVTARTVSLAALAGIALLPGPIAHGAPSVVDKLAPIGVGPRPPVLATRPVTETLWGQTITDRYRSMEALGPETLGWIKQQGAYTRRVLDAIRPLAALQARVAAFTGSFGLIQSYSVFGGRTFYEERAPGSDAFDLIVRDAAGTRTLVDIAADRAKSGGKPLAINWILPSDDGSKVAVGISEGGSEAASLSVYDAVTGGVLAGPIDRAQYGATSWSDDGRTVYFIRLKALGPHDPGTETYRDPSLVALTIGTAPRPLYGALQPDGPRFKPDETPVLAINPGASIAVLEAVNGVQNELKLWEGKVADAEHVDAHWTPFADRSDGITGFDTRGDELFLLSHKDAPTFKVLAVKAGAALADATTLVPALPDRVIQGVHAASDALYVVAQHGAYSELLRIPAGSSTIETVALPTRGDVTEAFTDPTASGISISLQSWATPPVELRYDPATRTFTDLHLGTKGDIDPADFPVRDIEARARDGVMIPLSLIEPRGVAHPAIVALEAYGSYGISESADFSPRRAIVMKQGISYGVCHVRGGGEKGEAWRLGGKDANKHNTWQDLIACAETLVKTGVTSSKRLFIIGGSAGGIPMGRAMEERPDLFAGMIDVVPVANPLRQEFSPNGPDNIPEFGSIRTEQGFKDLLAEDSVQHVRKGVVYPAVMISTGLNDPRVSPWEPAKFAAALMASGTPNPVLLRVDADAGHGIGATRTQSDLLTADWIAFMLWRSGAPGWRPDADGR